MVFLVNVLNYIDFQITNFKLLGETLLDFDVHPLYILLDLIC